MRHFFQHSPFITNTVLYTGTNRQGSLANIQLEGEESFQHAPFITGTNRQGSLANIQLEGEESFHHAPFITGTNRQGSLANIQLEGEEYKKGFLAFLRLVGTVYHKKQISQGSRHHHQLATFCSLQR